MVRRREAPSRTMKAVIQPHRSLNERISWSLNGFNR
jgi:hypothetical protein